MKPLTSAFSAVRCGLAGSAVLLTCSLLAPLPVLAAQEPPLVGGGSTLVLEGTTVDKEYAAAGTVIVKTLDGVEHVFHYTKGLVVHGGKGGGVEALQGLRAGTTVAVHYTGADHEASALEIDQIGDDGLRATEGTVIRIDRSRKHITIRFDDGHTETLELTDRAATGVGHDLDQTPNATPRVTVYYTDESGRKVAHYFKKTS